MCVSVCLCKSEGEIGGMASLGAHAQALCVFVFVFVFVFVSLGVRIRGCGSLRVCAQAV